MADLSPPWGNAEERDRSVVIHCKAAPHRDIARIPASVGDARIQIARLLQSAPDLWEAATAVIERHGDVCDCDDCVPLRRALDRANGKIT